MTFAIPKTVVSNEPSQLRQRSCDDCTGGRTAIVGMGAISNYYLKAFEAEDGLDLVAVCDSDERRLEAGRRSGLQTMQDFHQLLQLPELDAVIICLPNDMHYGATKAALLAGKHVCCEKPLAFTVAEATELTELAERQGRTLLTSLHRRYNANVLAAKASIGARKVVHIDARYLEKIEDHSGVDTWYLDAVRCGGGCVADNGPNVFDTMSLFIANLEVIDCDIERRAGVDVRAQVRLRGDGGATGNVVLDWSFDGERKDLDIRLDDGTEVYADMLAGFSGFKSSLDHEYVAILADFRTRIAEKQFAGVEGVRAVELVDAAYRLSTDALSAAPLSSARPMNVV